MLAELKTGLQNLANGVVNTLRGEKTGALVVATTHGQFNESAMQGSIMYATTAVAGVAPGTAFSASPPPSIMESTFKW